MSLDGDIEHPDRWTRPGSTVRAGGPRDGRSAALSRPNAGRAVTRWQHAWNSDSPPVLTYWSTSGFLHIYDGRRQGHEGTYTFHDTLTDIHVACGDRPITASAVRDKLELDLPSQSSKTSSGSSNYVGLMFVDDSLALALALPTVAGR